MNIKEKLLIMQTELSVPKDQRNDFGNFDYRRCEDILDATKPYQKELKFLILLDDEIEMRGERYYVKATATIVDVESEDDAAISVSAYAREADHKTKMDDAQVTGASSSYARKYALGGLLDLNNNKDPDAMNNRTQTKKKPPAKKQAADEVYKCDDCGKVFEPQWSEAKQRWYSAEEIYNGWKKQSPDGIVRCKDCLKIFNESTNYMDIMGEYAND